LRLCGLLGGLRIWGLGIGGSVGGSRAEVVSEGQIRQDASKNELTQILEELAASEEQAETPSARTGGTDSWLWTAGVKEVSVQDAMECQAGSLTDQHSKMRDGGIQQFMEVSCAEMKDGGGNEWTSSD
jgi:hypothetical protein